MRSIGHGCLCLDPSDGLDSADDDGELFDGYVTTALCLKRYERGDGSDLDKYTRLEREADREQVWHREQAWTRELERAWPVIRTVAALLLDGCTDVAALTAAAEAAFRAKGRGPSPIRNQVEPDRPSPRLNS